MTPPVASRGLSVEGFKLPEARRLVEQERHVLCHLPHADWCPECVAARARDDVHHAKKEPAGSEAVVAVVQLDHTNIEDMIAFSLYSLDWKCGAVTLCPSKQIGPHVVRWALAHLSRLGFGDIRLRTDLMSP